MKQEANTVSFNSRYSIIMGNGLCVMREYLLIQLPLLAFFVSLSLYLSYLLLLFLIPRSHTHPYPPHLQSLSNCSGCRGDSSPFNMYWFCVLCTVEYAILVIPVLFSSLYHIFFSHHPISLFMLHAYSWDISHLVSVHTLIFQMCFQVSVKELIQFIWFLNDILNFYKSKIKYII